MLAIGKRLALSTGWTLKLLARNKSLPLVVAILVLMFTVPAVYPLGTGGSAFSPPYYEALNDSLKNSLVGDAPPIVLEVHAEKERLVGEILSARTPVEYYDAVARYERYESDTLGAGGTLVYEGDFDPRLAFRATALLAERISGLDHPEVYFSTDQMPALFYTLLCMESYPYLIVLLPLFAASFLLVKIRSGKGLLTAIPVTPCEEFASSATAILAVSALSLGAICLPGGVIALLHNGLGDPLYPAVYIYNDTVFETTVGRLLVEYLVMYLMVSLFFAMLVSLLSLFLPGLLTKGAVAVLAATPLVQEGIAFFMPGGSAAFLPATYINIPSVIGYPAYAIGGNISNVDGLGFETGIATLGISCLLLAIVFGVLRGLSRRGLPKRGRRCAMLEVENLSIRYGKKTICKDASFGISPGEIVGLVAPNGYGKTSVLQAIGGHSPFYQGELAADGSSKRRDGAAFRRKVLYMPDAGQILHPELTVREHLVMTASLWDTGRSCEEVACECGVSPFCNVPARKLSQGMAQLASLAIAYASGAAYCLLDEPTNGLDRTNSQLFKRVILKLCDRGAGILLSSHHLEGLDEICDSVLLLHDARIHQVGISDQQGCVDLYSRCYEPTKEAHDEF